MKHRLASRLLLPALLVAMALAGAEPATAQQRNGEAFVTQAGGSQATNSTDPTVSRATQLRESVFRTPPPANWAAASGGAAATRSSLDGNIVSIQQDGVGNLVDVSQSGTGNFAQIFQLGDGNEVRAVQDGTDNVFRAHQEGSSNIFRIIQSGSDNLYEMSFHGHAQTTSGVQIGTGNRAVQVGEGSLPFGIEQRGHGMEIHIEHNGMR